MLPKSLPVPRPPAGYVCARCGQSFSLGQVDAYMAHASSCQGR